MARGNMVVTLVAQTKNFSKGLRDAGKHAINFGSLLKTGFGLAVTAIGAAAGALLGFVPNLIRMAEEGRRSERLLSNITTQMGLFGKNTEKVTDRLSKYAERISFATGVDDELVRSGEAILMTFKNVATQADKVGGVFDRATIAAVDLAAAGFGDVESNAKQLGKALQDPTNGLTALRKAGVTFTDAEKKKIKALQESGQLLEAQNIVLGAIEQQVGGTAEATASSMDKMQARFEDVGEQLGTALLPAVDNLATQMGDWLDSIEGKKAIENLTTQLSNFGAWIASPEGQASVKEFMDSMVTLAEAIISVGEAIEWVAGLLAGFDFAKLDKVAGGAPALNLIGSSGQSGYSGNLSMVGGKPPVTVNVQGLTPSATIGKTVISAVRDAERLGARK